VKGLVPEVVEQKLREKLDPAYRFHDANLVDAPEVDRNKKPSDKKRKRKA
jgi:hypothetical protein